MLFIWNSIYIIRPGRVQNLFSLYCVLICKTFKLKEGVLSFYRDRKLRPYEPFSQKYIPFTLIDVYHNSIVFLKSSGKFFHCIRFQGNCFSFPFCYLSLFPLCDCVNGSISWVIQEHTQSYVSMTLDDITETYDTSSLWRLAFWSPITIKWFD